MERHKNDGCLRLKKNVTHQRWRRERSVRWHMISDVTYKEHEGTVCIQMIYIEMKALVMRLTNMTE